MKRILSVGLIAAAIALSACGGSKSDSDKIKDVVKKVDKNPAALCDNATANLLKQLGGKASCVQLSKANGDKSPSTVSNIQIKGDTATAMVKDKNSNSKVTFKKEGGNWKVDSST